MKGFPIGELCQGIEKAVAKHKPALPAPPARTPAPERTKVVENPARKPINRQAARIIAPARCWTEKPLPEKPKAADPREIEQLRAELKSERNAHALTSDALGAERQKSAALRKMLSALQIKVSCLEGALRERDATIRQLEDIKL